MQGGAERWMEGARWMPEGTPLTFCTFRRERGPSTLPIFVIQPTEHETEAAATTTSGKVYVRLAIGRKFVRKGGGELDQLAIYYVCTQSEQRRAERVVVKKKLYTYSHVEVTIDGKV